MMEQVFHSACRAMSQRQAGCAKTWHATLDELIGLFTLHNDPVHMSTLTLIVVQRIVK